MSHLWNLWQIWGMYGKQRSPKRTLGTSFRLQTLSICVTNNFYHCASKSCFVYARRVTWEKKSFRIFWKCQISNRGKVLVWFVLRKAPVKVDTTILRNKAVTVLPIFSLNNKFYDISHLFDNAKSRKAPEGLLVLLKFQGIWQDWFLELSVVPPNKLYTFVFFKSLSRPNESLFWPLNSKRIWQILVDAQEVLMPLM